MTSFWAIMGGVAIGETIAGLSMSLIAAQLNKRTRQVRRGFAKLHESERKGK